MEQLVKAHPVTVEWRAFELRPAGVEAPPKPEAYLRRAWEGVHRLCAQFNLPEMRRNSHQPHSRLALEGQKFAAAAGRVEAYNDAVFAAMFNQDLDIGDPSVLAACAEVAGLDAAAFGEALADRRHSAAVEADRQLAAQWGITAIPCFVVPERRTGVMGVQSYADLEELIRGDAEPPR